MQLKRSEIGFSSLAFIGLVVVAAVAACSSPSPPAKPPPGLTCTDPGEATPGPEDTHCVGQPVQVVNPASCSVDAAAAATGDDAAASAEGGSAEGGADTGGAEGGDNGAAGDDGGAPSSDEDCEYGATMFGGTAASDGGLVVTEGDDDDCKYHVAWTSTPICHSPTLPVTFTVTVTNLTTGLPVTDIPSTEGILPEAFIPTTLDAACDTMTTHPSPTLFGDAHLYETSPSSGVYVGQIIFDQAGEWTVRFHIHEECSDSLPDSPHGHAAFHLTVH
jgi:hypothetical protein